MTRRVSTIPTTFFDDLYRGDPDPWRFATSAYERDKYDDTLAMLSHQRYDVALEVGCSIGVFTRELAARCGRLVAVEPSAPALAQARETCAGLDNIAFGSDSLPHAMPEGRFDLIVLSEVIYYLAVADAEAACRMCCEALAPGGEIVLCHWLGETDYPLTGDEAAAVALAEARRRGWSTRTVRRSAYRLDHIRGGVAA